MSEQNYEGLDAILISRAEYDRLLAALGDRERLRKALARIQQIADLEEPGFHIEARLWNIGDIAEKVLEGRDG